MTHTADSASKSSSRRFWAFAAAVVAGNVLLATRFHAWQGPQVPEWPVAFDLLVLLPLAYLWVHRRRGKQALMGAAALAGIGIFIGKWILPADSQVLWHWLLQARYLVIGAVVLTQLAMIVLIVRETRQASRAGDNLEVALDDALTRRLGVNRWTALFRMEARLWLFALMRKPIKAAYPGKLHFFGHAQGSNASNQQAFLIIAAAEIPIAHVLLHVIFNAHVALVVTVLSVYGFAFLLAEYRATLQRPTSIEATGVHVRSGLTGDCRIPLQAIASIEPWAGKLRRARKRLRFYGMGDANVRLQLRAGTRIDTLFGEREIDEVFLGLDDAAAFMRALQHRIDH